MVSLPACVWLVSTLAAAGNPPSVVVLPLRAEAGVEKGSARILSEKLLDSVRHTRAFHRVVGLGDVEAALEVEQKRQLMDCASDSCAAELAGALGPQRAGRTAPAGLWPAIREGRVAADSGEA